MKTQKVEFPDNLKILWTNTTGGDIAADVPVVIQGRVYITFVPIANGQSGTLLESGRYRLAKVTGTAFAQGDHLCWDTANARLDLKSAKPDMPSAGRCARAAASAEAWAEVDLNAGVGVKVFGAVVSAAQAAANSGSGLVAFNTGVVNPASRCVVTVITATTGVEKSGYKIATDGAVNTTLNVFGIAAGVQIDEGDIVNVMVF